VLNSIPRIISVGKDKNFGLFFQENEEKNAKLILVFFSMNKMKLVGFRKKYFCKNDTDINLLPMISTTIIIPGTDTYLMYSDVFIKKALSLTNNHKTEHSQKKK